MDRHVMWIPWDGPGLEHLRLTQDQGSIVADGVIIGLTEGEPFRVHYTINCDERWQMHAVDLVSLGSDRHEVHLRTDGAGRWTTATGESLPALTDCLEVDISATPFTNTLPIRRLALRPGESRDVSAVYISIAGFTVSPAPQRYTRLEAPAGPDKYLYEGLLWNFQAELPVDSDGMVTDYPGFFRRVWEG
jgi:hypothetical protein